MSWFFSFLNISVTVAEKYSPFASGLEIGVRLWGRKMIAYIEMLESQTDARGSDNARIRELVHGEFLINQHGRAGSRRSSLCMAKSR
jgi:hypothetical protein